MKPHAQYRRTALLLYIAIALAAASLLGVAGFSSTALADEQYDITAAIRQLLTQDPYERDSQLSWLLAKEVKTEDDLKAIHDLQQDPFVEVIFWQDLIPQADPESGEEKADPEYEAILQGILNRIEVEGRPLEFDNDPVYNPTAMRDVILDPNAVYGVSPNPDDGKDTPEDKSDDSTLTNYAQGMDTGWSDSDFAKCDWSDPKFVAKARQNRIAFHKGFDEMHAKLDEMMAEDKPVEEMARTLSDMRNKLRLDSCNTEEEREILKARNLETYGHEEGPTPEQLYEKYGSWETVLDKSFSSNPGMDACCGLYDDYYEDYILFGQIPQHTVSFDAAGHGTAPESQLVYAGEYADEPADPTAEGWKFLGWYAADSDEAFDFTLPIAADVKLTAKWEQVPVSAGQVFLAPEVKDGAKPYVTNVTMGTSARSVLSDGDLARVANGENATVSIIADGCTATSGTRSEMSKAAATKLGANSQVAVFIDVDLYKTLSNDSASTKITEPGTSVTVVLTLASKNIPSDAAKRSWCVVRAPGDASDVLPATFDPASGTVTFSTNYLSSFAVAYSARTSSDSSSDSSGKTPKKDTKELKPSSATTTRAEKSAKTAKEKTEKTSTTSSRTKKSKNSKGDSVPTTGDPTSLAGAAVAFMAGGSALAVGLKKRRQARPKHGAHRRR